MPARFGEVPLRPRTAKALELVVDRVCAAVVTAVRVGAPDYEVYAACLDYQEGVEFDVPAVALGRECNRRELVAEMNPYDAWEQVWEPEMYTGPWLQLDPRPSLADDFAEAEHDLQTDLQDRVADPGRWVLCRSARRLEALRLPVNATADFVVFVSDHHDPDQLLATLRFVAPEPKARLLETKGLLPRRLADLAGYPDSYG